MIKILGEGSYGKVILVKENNSSKYFAMKVIKKSFLGNFLMIEKIKD